MHPAHSPSHSSAHGANGPTPAASPPRPLEAVVVDVLIIGAGPAGIAAAIELQQQGRSYLILEARNRVGGRVLTSDDLGVPVDLGASWIHHYGADNPAAREAWVQRAPLGVPAGGADLWVSRSGVEPVTEEHFEQARDTMHRIEARREQQAIEHNDLCHRHSPFVSEDWNSYVRSTQQPSPSPAPVSEGAPAASAYDSTAFHDTRPLQPCAQHDQSFAAFLQSFPDAASLLEPATSPSPQPAAAAGASATPSLSSAIVRALLKDVEQYEGTPLTRLSAVHGGDQLAGVPGCDMQCAGGYGRLLTRAATRHALRVHLDTVVSAIDMQMDEVIVHARRLSPHQRAPSQHGSHCRPVEQPHAPTANGDVGEPITYRCKYCILTVPLGVLQRSLISFTPALPAWKRTAIDSLGFGLLNKVMLQFDEPWWEEDGSAPETNILNVLQEGDEPPLWIVAMARPLQAAARLQQRMDAADPHARDAVWQQHMRNVRPLQPSMQDDEEYERAASIEQSDGNTVAAGVLPVAAGASSPRSSSFPSASASPYVLVSFTSGFSAESGHTASASEMLPDSVLVAQLMRQLRRAFQGGEERALQTDEDLAGRSINVSSSSTETNVSKTHSFDSADALITASHSNRSLSVPIEFARSRPVWRVSTRPARRVPEPVGYVVTRWGLEAYSHGAYAHYRPGAGPHTAAELAKPVQVMQITSASAGQTPVLRCVEENASGTDSSATASETRSSTRLLFAGEATLGVTLGCVDSAWLSGMREAKRIAQLWSQQELRVSS